jgi:hypothetical protein
VNRVPEVLVGGTHFMGRKRFGESSEKSGTSFLLETTTTGIGSGLT